MSKETITEEMIDRWDKQLEYCIEHQDKLNDWEIEFISSIFKQKEYRNDLTIKQSFKLNDIYNKI